ncbi:uncharacterized protein PHACADRAFT_176005 [Phanerochaete carnosa HHB-10118-sp]|uniref:DNA polymerase n=1 Tax=Phanerochaete carnosa (strain HHB-10118-sp) TaxID=650164 RepID=K5UUC0_PHACS|nr:uncharacterized protein PHACADRAFT_176005 [Phanerochaete carnosa HHB-10118-sp]EKM53596.1 hypothetical protein PHACADRAFT_176005 [Phanerochaete carnosa HHB-10118-sp]
MPFKRPAAAYHESSGYSSGRSKPPETSPDVNVPSKRSKVRRSAKIFPSVKAYIVQAKMDGPTIAELFMLAERHCERLCDYAEDADVIITSITMRRRLERHIYKAVVTPAWLRDSVAEGEALECTPYVALQDLREETINNCPVCNVRPCECEDTDVDEQAPGPETSYPSPPTPAPKSKLAVAGPSTLARPIPSHLLPLAPPIPTELSKLRYASKYACQRASPLICLNQALAVELDIIKRSRALEGEERSALSYSRAISAIKAYPRRITSIRQVEELSHVGTIANSERFKALSLFSSIYGIGPSTARRLYALGLRTVDDLEVYFGVEPEEEESQLVELEHHERFGRASESGLGETWIKIALGLRNDFELMIPRAEVEEMGRVVMDELNIVEHGCVSTIVGGYRRGKPQSNDVDIVFTHPDPTKSKGLCKRFVHHLHKKGMVTHVMHLSGFHGHNPLRTTHWDSLEKALTVFILPPSSPFYKGTRRRMDLIFAQPEVYWCAVIGWSGSIMFQRDIRQWAKDKKGMKFDSSGITRRYDSKPFYPKTEKEVFDLFGLEWVDPVWRNADV